MERIFAGPFSLYRSLRNSPLLFHVVCTMLLSAAITSEGVSLIKFSPLFSLLDRKKIRYLLVTGIPDERAAADTDMIVDFEEANLNGFVDVLKELGFKTKTSLIFEEFVRKEKRETWMRYKGMTAFTVFEPGDPSDLLNILIEVPFDFNKAYEAREEIKIKDEDTVIFLLPRQYRIKFKDKTGGFHR